MTTPQEQSTSARERAGFPRTLTIELAGLMCSGKSTLAISVIENLRAAGYRCPTARQIDRWRSLAGFHSQRSPSRAIRTLKLLLAGVRHPIAFLRLLLWCSRQLHSLPPNALSYKGVLKFAALQRAIADTRRYDVVVWDEGPIACAQHLATDHRRAELRELTANIALDSDTHYVLLITPVSEILRRLRLRYPSGLREKNARFLTRRLMKRQTLYEDVIQLIVSKAGHRAIRVPHETNASTVEHLVVQFIRDCLNPREKQVHRETAAAVEL